MRFGEPPLVVGLTAMRVTTFYRLSIWLPLVVPAIFAGLRYGLGVNPGPYSVYSPVIGILMASLLYGGIPYAALGLWATWRIGGYSEREVTRLMLKAPLLMIGASIVFWLLTGLRVGQPQFVMVGVLSGLFVIPLGYGYVGFVFLLRSLLRGRLADEDPAWPT